MEAIFNGPMVAGSLQKARCLVRETADIVSGSAGSNPVLSALALDTNQRLQVAPTCIVANVFKNQRVSNGPTTTNFNASVVLVYSFSVIHAHLDKAVLVTLQNPDS